MADRPISDLPVATEANSTDYLIINKNDRETRKISMANFSSDSGFTPFMVSYGSFVRNNLTMIQPGETYVAPGQSAQNPTVSTAQDLVTNNTFDTGALDSNGNTQRTNLFTATATFTLPAGADSALLFFGARVVGANQKSNDLQDDGSLLPSTVAYYHTRGRITYKNQTTDATFQSYQNLGQSNFNSSGGFSVTQTKGASEGRRYNTVNLNKFVKMGANNGAGSTINMK